MAGIESKLKMSFVPKFDAQRRWIFLIWLACLAVNLALILHLDFSQYQTIDNPPVGWREPIDKVYTDLIALYAPPLTTMLAIGFARKTNTSSRTSSLFSFLLAICLSVGWNGIVVIQNSRMSVLNRLDIQSFVSFLPVLPGRLSFLVTPLLAFYFSSEHHDS